MSEIATVYLVDDDSSFLTAMSRFLRAAGFCVNAFASGLEFLREMSMEARGCVVADLEMPDVSGLELQATLARAGATMPVIFLTGHGDIRTSVQAMRGGATDFLEKCAPKDEVIAAITAALALDEAEYTARRRLQEIARRFALLTKREREVLQLVVRGKMNKEIAAALGIHERTVKLHRTAVTSKVGVHSAAQLATLTREARFFEHNAPTTLGN